MQVDDKTFIVNSLPSLAAFWHWFQGVVEQHKYVTVSLRIGADRSLDQNALLHVWLTEYAAHLLKKDRRLVTEGELEGIKRIVKKAYYGEHGQPWMVLRPIDPRTGEEGAAVLRSSKNYTRGEMFQFLTWLQMKAAEDGVVLESKGQYAKLQREQHENA